MERELATRIYNLLDPWEKVDVSIDEIEEGLKSNPIDAVKFLLERFEEV